MRVTTEAIGVWGNNKGGEEGDQGLSEDEGSRQPRPERLEES